MKCGYLNELVEIVKSARKSVTINRLRFCGDIYSALHLLNYMNGKKIDTGILLETFTELRNLFNEQEFAAELLDRSYEEIIRLLGNDAWRIREFQEKRIA